MRAARGLCSQCYDHGSAGYGPVQDAAVAGTDNTFHIVIISFVTRQNIFRLQKN